MGLQICATGTHDPLKKELDGQSKITVKGDGIDLIMIYPKTTTEADMKVKKENRKELRYRCDATIEWAYFNKIDRSDGILLNYSKVGGYFESAIRPLPRSTIFMRFKQCNLKNSIFLNRDHVRTATLARVEWCSPISGKQQTSYAVGVKFFEHYDG